MKKVLKFIGKTLLVILLLILLFLLGMTIYNVFRTKSEKPVFDQNPGKLVEVDGSNMNIYTEGEGDHTLVFMAGWGTPSPIYDFRPLYEKLTDDCRIVVIEKFGYGFSDETDTPRDFDTMLRQDREALTKAGIEGPYILCPHSLSGLEAMIWAQKYPEELEGIIGLDITLPDGFDYKKYMPLIRMTKVITKLEGVTGIIRLMSDEYADWCTEEEQKQVEAINVRTCKSSSMLKEIDGVLDVFDEIKSAPLPKTPTIQFVSGQNKTNEAWTKVHKAVADSSDNGKYVELEGGHYVHLDDPEIISEYIKEFLKELDK